MPTGKPAHVSETMVRLFGTLPVVEATGELLIIGKPNDAKGAVRLDAKNCFWSRACHRLFDSSACVFFRTIAYVDLPDTRGRRRLMRFKLPKETRDNIAKFDATGEIMPGGYKLLPPCPAEKLDALAKQGAKHRLAIIKGRSNNRRQPKIVSAGTVEIRNGTGMVHFTRKEKPQGGA